MCKPFLIRSHDDPGIEYELCDVEKFRELYPRFYVSNIPAGGALPEGLASHEMAPHLRPMAASLDETPVAVDVTPVAVDVTPVVSTPAPVIDDEV